LYFSVFYFAGLFPSCSLRTLFFLMAHMFCIVTCYTKIVSQ
jgi:hypothetical protein